MGASAEKVVRQKWCLLQATMDERARRLWSGTEAGAIGWEGVAAVARATGMAISTVRKGRDEARRGATPENVVKVRGSAGKRPYEVAHPEVWPALENLIDPITRGDPESPLRWTCKSTHALSAELFVRHGIRISHKTVAKLLRDHGYSLQAPNKSVEGAQHPDRNAQFEHINAKAQAALIGACLRRSSKLQGAMSQAVHASEADEATDVGQPAKQVVRNQLMTPLCPEVIERLRWLCLLETSYALVQLNLPTVSSRFRSR